MLKQGIQDFISSVGAEGCYALTLCRVAELAENTDNFAGDAVNSIANCVKTGQLAPDMTVLDGAAFLRHITLRRWTKEYRDAGYKPKIGDYLVAEWYNKRTGKTHFTLEYPEKWNSLENSVTVKEGFIRSYRLYRVRE
jgi:hypothetical protein